MVSCSYIALNLETLFLRLSFVFLVYVLRRFHFSRLPDQTTMSGIKASTSRINGCVGSLSVRFKSVLTVLSSLISHVDLCFCVSSRRRDTWMHFLDELVSEYLNHLIFCLQFSLESINSILQLRVHLLWYYAFVRFYWLNFWYCTVMPCIATRERFIGWCIALFLNSFFYVLLLRWGKLLFELFNWKLLRDWNRCLLVTECQASFTPTNFHLKMIWLFALMGCLRTSPL